MGKVVKSTNFAHSTKSTAHSAKSDSLDIESDHPGMPFASNPDLLGTDPPVNSKKRTVERLLFVLVILSSAWYMGKNLKRGWVPHDEGTLAQSAERILQGELPHRDFDEIYTGGLSFLNAAAFRVFGRDFASMRYVLFAFAVGWAICIYFVASRLMPFPIAAAITLLAVTWSIPNYSAALPSWYNLFFATFGLAALLRFIDLGNRRYLFMSGLCGGISFLFKLSGLYFIAGVLLFLLFREQVMNRGVAQSTPRRNPYRVFLILVLSGYLLVLLSVIAKDFRIASLAYFFVPALAIAAAILHRELTTGGQPDCSRRFVFLFRDVAVFVAGAFLPVFVFLLPYAAQGGLNQFLYGVFVLPGKRFENASLPPGLVGLAVGVFIDIVLIALLYSIPPSFKKFFWLAFLATPVAIVWGRLSADVYKVEWSTIWASLPVCVISGSFLLSRMEANLAPLQQQKVFLTISVAAACGLIQLPYASAIYFVYVAPLVFLAVAAVLSLKAAPSPVLIAAGYIFCFGFVVFNLTPGFLYEMGRRYSRNKQTAVLTVPRGGKLSILPASADQYSNLMRIIAKHASGEYIYATPDCPEMYFLSAHRNPTRTLFEFLDDSRGRTERILNSIRDHNVNLVVLNENPSFSGPVPEDLKAALDQEFPNIQRTVSFEIRWRP